MKQKFLFLLTILFGLGLYAQPASALLDDDIALSIYPASQTIELRPGAEYRGRVEVANSGQRAFDLMIAAAPYSVNSETYEPDFDSRGNYTQLFDWISFPNENFHVEPGESAQVEFVVNVPEDAVGGGQYAAILARTEDSINPEASVQVISQVAGILYGRVSGEEMQPEGEVVEQKIPGWIFDGPLKISEITYNTGNIDFQVYHSMKIRNFFTGEEVVNSESTTAEGTKIGSATQVIYPKTSRENTLTWEGAPQLGVYKVEQKIVFLDQEVTTEQIVMFCPLWLILAVAGLILLLILWILLVIRRHKRKQPQVF